MPCLELEAVADVEVPIERDVLGHQDRAAARRARSRASASFPSLHEKPDTSKYVAGSIVLTKISSFFPVLVRRRRDPDADRATRLRRRPAPRASVRRVRRPAFATRRRDRRRTAPRRGRRSRLGRTGTCRRSAKSIAMTTMISASVYAERLRSFARCRTATSPTPRADPVRDASRAAIASGRSRSGTSKHGRRRGCR